MQSKRDEVRAFMERWVFEAILLHTAHMGDRTSAETIRGNSTPIANMIARTITEQYRFLELTDIFEWKRERVRR